MRCAEVNGACSFNPEPTATELSGGNRRRWLPVKRDASICRCHTPHCYRTARLTQESRKDRRKNPSQRCQAGLDARVAKSLRRLIAAGGMAGGEGPLQSFQLFGKSQQTHLDLAEGSPTRGRDE